uniref:Uncharacterized protein n=1 Tax=Candidatus Kentrum sp. FM TaxID=2126340 RepID=A0A450VM05_9GAMM|nr:MAG: hypothetical protein BECKFM1743A_GA0114220_100084 [Candidatus Kentron sp. FM]VFJ43855.1 MAG: hypothetical protein BECKFM1743C_GA0114222_100046 [Candidatus Kentron sp. FM]VFK05771.1 MAG: hypothetical protein BECKFM1743B_GA0114221_1000425 [Candidatus Kentron sp. FM]
MNIDAVAMMREIRGDLLTWNFRHINNAQTRGAITRIIQHHGFVCPVLCSPEELGGMDYA